MKRLLADERVPRRAKLPIFLLIPYLASPIDLIPDFIPVLGQLDDAVFMAIVIAYVVRVAVTELWPGSERGLGLLLAVDRASA